MNSNSSLQRPVIFFTLLALIGAAGCQNAGQKKPEFFADTEIRSIQSTLEQQRINGARYDAMLRDQHFAADGRLNALGQAKLNRILAEPGVTTVYLPGSSLDPRRQAVLAYAKDHGRSETDIQVVPGINPATNHPAAAELTRLDKTELGNKQNQGSTSVDMTESGGGLGLSGNNSPAYPGSTGKGSMQ